MTWEDFQRTFPHISDKERHEAENLKWERFGTVMLRQLKSGKWAMYHLGGLGSVFWIGPLDELAEAYANRPAPPERHESLPSPRRTSISGIDLSKVRITL